MREPADLFRWILPSAPSCPDPVAETHIIAAARDFCRATRCWREKDDVEITGEEDEVLCVPPAASLFEIEEAYFDGRKLERVAFLDAELDRCCMPSQISQIQPNSVAVAPRGRCGTLSISMFLMPAQDADILPEFLFDQFGEIIAQGALSTILLVPNQPFSNGALATYNAGLFADAKARYFNHHRRGQQRAPVRTRASYL